MMDSATLCTSAPFSVWLAGWLAGSVALCRFIVAAGERRQISDDGGERRMDRQRQRSAVDAGDREGGVN